MLMASSIAYRHNLNMDIFHSYNYFQSIESIPSGMQIIGFASCKLQHRQITAFL